MTSPKTPAGPLRTIAALSLGGIAVVVCYFFVDRPVAWFMHNHRFYSHAFRAGMVILSDWLTGLAIVGIVAIVVWRVLWPGGRNQTLFFAIALNLTATAAIKVVLKWAFGRAWPETWIGHNPSLIADGVYGFHPFQFSQDYQSFPSGHAAATFAVVSILWLSRPKWRWLYALAAGLVCLSLVAMNYHFVGDVIAGAMLGAVTGQSAARIFRLRLAD